MKTIGLIGGMSWESSAVYYRILNREIARRLGGLHSARCVMLSVDFAEIAALQEADAWDEAGRLLAADARRLEAAGAELLLLCANTMHRVADAVEAAISIPLLHLADATAASVRQAGMTTVGLLGTRLHHGAGLLPRPPRRAPRPAGADARGGGPGAGPPGDLRGAGPRRADDGSRTELRRMIAELADRGAEGVILGCTELPLLLLDEQASGEGESPVPLFDTTRIHAEAAADAALTE